MRQIRFLIILAIAFGFTACNNSKKNKETPDENSEMFEVEMDNTSVKKVFFNLPSPIELTQTLLTTDAPFDKQLLNPIESLDNYSTSASLALNFGVYGADLCYCRVYDELQESINYLATIRKITDLLQIPEEEGSKTINRIEESIADRDSIFQIISETYASADGYLKENERDMMAAFILVGGWVEGMHFAVTLLPSDSESGELITRVAEQKYSMDNILAALEEYKDNPEMKELYPKFERLAEVYEEVSIFHEKPVVITDHEENITTIDKKASIDITPEQISEITTLLGEIRTKIVS